MNTPTDPKVLLAELAESRALAEMARELCAALPEHVRAEAAQAIVAKLLDASGSSSAAREAIDRVLLPQIERLIRVRANEIANLAKRVVDAAFEDTEERVLEAAQEKVKEIVAKTKRGY